MSILSLVLPILLLSNLINFIECERRFPCRRVIAPPSDSGDERVNLISPEPLPKSNLEISLEPLQTAVDWTYDFLQPRTDLFEYTVTNVSEVYTKILSDPTGPQTRRLVFYYGGYFAVAAVLLIIAAFWPLVGFCFCCCRCCCKSCCYGPRGDIYSPKKNGCRRGTCGFLFFLLLLMTLGACLGCFISAVTFRFSTTSTTTINAAAAATASAYKNNAQISDDSSSSAYIITERIGAASLDVIDSVRDLGHAYARILRKHVADLTEAMMSGVQELVQQLATYLDVDWLGGANATLEGATVLQQNITGLWEGLVELNSHHRKTTEDIQTCMYNAQRLRSSIEEACSETETRECSRDLTSQLYVLGIPAKLWDIFEKFQPIDEATIQDLKGPQVGKTAQDMIDAYAKDLKQLQDEAYRVAGGSSIRRSVFNTLNNSLGLAADLLVKRTDKVCSYASKAVIDAVCSAESQEEPTVAKYVQPTLDYTFYALMAISSVIGLFVIFIGLSVLTCCAGRPYYKRSSCLAMTAIGFTFLFASVLAASGLIVFLLTSLTYSEVCRPIERQDTEMFKMVDDYFTRELANAENYSNDQMKWPPELIFASSSQSNGSEAWSFSFGKVLKACSENASLITALELHLPQSKLSDKLINSIRSEMKTATNDAIMKIQSRIDDIENPSENLKLHLNKLSQLKVNDLELPNYPSHEEVIRLNSGSSLSRLSYRISIELGFDSSLIDSVKSYDEQCQGELVSEALPWLLKKAASVQRQAKHVNMMAKNLTDRVDFIIRQVGANGGRFQQVLSDASKTLSNHVEQIARKKMADFEDILTRDDAGRCIEAADNVMTASEVVCRPLSVLSVFSLLLLGVVIITVPLMLCVGAPFAQTLRWPSSPSIPGLHPHHGHGHHNLHHHHPYHHQMAHAPGFEGLPLLDLLPRYQKIG